MTNHWVAFLVGLGVGAAAAYVHCNVLGGRGMGQMPKIQMP